MEIGDGESLITQFIKIPKSFIKMTGLTFEETGLFWAIEHLYRIKNLKTAYMTYSAEEFENLGFPKENQKKILKKLEKKKLICFMKIKNELRIKLKRTFENPVFNVNYCYKFNGQIADIIGVENAVVLQVIEDAMETNPDFFKMLKDEKNPFEKKKKTKIYTDINYIFLTCFFWSEEKILSILDELEHLKLIHKKIFSCGDPFYAIDFYYLKTINSNFYGKTMAGRRTREDLKKDKETFKKNKRKYEQKKHLKAPQKQKVVSLCNR